MTDARESEPSRLKAWIVVIAWIASLVIFGLMVDWMTRPFFGWLTNALGLSS